MQAPASTVNVADAVAPETRIPLVETLSPSRRTCCCCGFPCCSRAPRHLLERDLASSCRLGFGFRLRLSFGLRFGLPLGVGLRLRARLSFGFGPRVRVRSRFSLRLPVGGRLCARSGHRLRAATSPECGLDPIAAWTRRLGRCRHNGAIFAFADRFRFARPSQLRDLVSVPLFDLRRLVRCPGCCFPRSPAISERDI